MLWVTSVPRLNQYFLFFSLNNESYNQLQKYMYLRHCTIVWLKWPVHDLVVVMLPLPFIKVASKYKTMLKTWRNNFEWEGGWGSVLYLTALVAI